MPPRELTADEQAFVDHWSQRMAYFVKMMRRADLYVRTIPREAWDAAYKEYANSGCVAGGEWETRKREGKKENWKPKPEDREAYVDYMQATIESHPLKSPNDAAAVIFSSNGGMMCVQNVIVAEQPGRVQKRFQEEWHKLNNQDLEDTKELRYGQNPPVSIKDIIAKDLDEDSNDEPFVRARPLPQDPLKMITSTEWRQVERLGETYFINDYYEEDDTGFSAFELTGISQRKSGKSYEVRYEGHVESTRITEQELFDMIEDGMWI